jgi:hypothetical protein
LLTQPFFFFKSIMKVSGVWVPVEIVGEGEHFPVFPSSAWGKKTGEAQPVCVADRPSYPRAASWQETRRWPC